MIMAILIAIIFMLSHITRFSRYFYDAAPPLLIDAMPCQRQLRWCRAYYAIMPYLLIADITLPCWYFAAICAASFWWCFFSLWFSRRYIIFSIIFAMLRYAAIFMILLLMLMLLMIIIKCWLCRWWFSIFFHIYGWCWCRAAARFRCCRRCCYSARFAAAFQPMPRVYGATSAPRVMRCAADARWIAIYIVALLPPFDFRVDADIIDISPRWCHFLCILMLMLMIYCCCYADDADFSSPFFIFMMPFCWWCCRLFLFRWLIFSPLIDIFRCLICWCFRHWLFSLSAAIIIILRHAISFSFSPCHFIYFHNI